MSPAGTQSYAGGSAVSIYAIPDSGYQFSYWTSSTTSGSITFDSATSATTTAHINGAGTVTANFNQIQTGQTYQVTFTTNGGGASSTTTPSGTQTYNAGQIVPISATAGSGYQFSSWANTGTISFDNPALASTNAHIGSDGSITANFATSSAPSKLAFITGTDQSLTINEVSQIITVQIQNANGNPFDATQATTVNLVASPSGHFHNNAGGSGTPITTVTISVGQNSASFYFQDATTGTRTITASSGTLTSATTQFTIYTNKVVFIEGILQTLDPGEMSQRITIQLQNSYNNPLSDRDFTVNFGTTSSGAFYSSQTSTTPITSLTINDDNHAHVYYKDSSIGTPTLTASVTNYSPDTTIFTIQGPKLAYSAGGGQTIAFNQVSYPINVQRQTGDGTPTTSGGTITVNLQTTASTSGRFYSDAGATAIITSITITSGSSTSPSFYYKDSTAGTPTLTASGTTYTSATTHFTITSQPLQTETLVNTGFDQNPWWLNWDIGTQPPWGSNTQYHHSGTTSASSVYNTQGPFTCEDKDASDAVAIHVTFWYMIRNLDPAQGDQFLLYYTGVAGLNNMIQIPNTDLATSAQNVWIQKTVTIIDDPANPNDNAFTQNFKFRFYSIFPSYHSQGVYVDDITITIDKVQ